MYVWVVQVQKDLVDLLRHYIEIEVLVSLDRVECFTLEKKNTQIQSHSSSKVLVYEASISVGFKCTK